MCLHPLNSTHVGFERCKNAFSPDSRSRYPVRPVLAGFWLRLVPVGALSLRVSGARGQLRLLVFRASRTMRGCARSSLVYAWPCRIYRAGVRRQAGELESRRGLGLVRACDGNAKARPGHGQQGLPFGIPGQDAGSEARQEARQARGARSCADLTGQCRWM